jgi:HrpA-like RNA helicase
MSRGMLELQGRQYPVQVMYTAAKQDSYMDAALYSVLQIHQQEAPGDVLVFLTGQDEIEALQRLLSERCLPLFSHGPPVCGRPGNSVLGVRVPFALGTILPHTLPVVPLAHAAVLLHALRVDV